MKTIEKFVPLEDLHVGVNVRINLMLDSLIPSIMQDGLHTPLMVNSDLKVIRGHRRELSLNSIKKSNPERFAELFPKGIPVVQVTGATDVELAKLHVDQGNVLQLSDPFELQLASNMLFAVGMTEAEVANHLAGLIDVFAPMKPERRRELDKIRDTEGDIAYFREYATLRRGYVQALRAAWQCPDVVMEALRYKATGILPDGKDEADMPRLTNAIVTKLSKTFGDDMGILNQNGVPKHSKIDPGPGFNAAWKDQVEKTIKNAGKEKNIRAKAWGGTKILDQVKVLASLTLKALCLQHAGKDVNASAIIEADMEMYYFELIKKHDPDLFAETINVGKEIEAARVKAKDEAAETESAAAPNAG